MTIRADGGQLDQLLINLVRNAVDAALEGGGQVELGWAAHNGRLEVWVQDDGPGLADTVNLFVPFYTTKTNGTGLGLPIVQKIIVQHGGSVEVRNQPQRGAEFIVSLPLNKQGTVSGGVVDYRAAGT